MKRHHIPKPDGSAYKPRDLAVGAEVIMYGRTFYIIGIDAHTRCYLERLGISMAPDQSYPESPYDTKLASLHSTGMNNATLHVTSKTLVTGFGQQDIGFLASMSAFP